MGFGSTSRSLLSLLSSRWWTLFMKRLPVTSIFRLSFDPEFTISPQNDLCIAALKMRTPIPRAFNNLGVEGVAVVTGGGGGRRRRWRWWW
ncbi:hypothetical protein Vadar_000557 [Vaccinium darrowii]|uniref:Uncharacterized protein n=1 Tax=Vaccinium darrowii TaxID=229202 RepID=A0ACB7XXD7_9ERIC|nr:hypothetical protein Vadar_000557 [Vaccinium darrowii]